MLKIFIKAIILLLFLGIFIQSQAQGNNPLIYQTFIRENFNVDGGQILIVDALTLDKVDKIVISPSNPQNIELTADKKLAFINNSPFVDPNKGMVVVDLVQKKVITRMFDGIGVYGLKLGSDGNIWVLLDETQEVVILNPKSLQIVERLKFPESPRDIIFSPDGSRAYISLFTSNVFVLDTRKKTTIRVISNLPDRNKFQIRPMELELSSDGNTLYVATEDTVSIVDTSSFRTVDSFSVPGNTKSLMLKINPNGNFLYIAEYLGGCIFTYDIASKQASNPVFTPNRGVSTGMNISQNGNTLYITDFYGISLWDTQSQKFIANPLISTGVGTPNPFSAGSTTSGDFSIGQAPTLQTTAPTASQQVMANQAVSIKWQTTVAPQSYSIASHRVELSTDGGSSFTVIKGAEELPATAQDFTWQVPDIETTKAQIRVSTVDLGARRASSTTSNFTISRNGGGGSGDTQAPVVNFLSPKGGERFNSGDSLQISWTSSDNVGVSSQDLSLSTDGGATFPITIASGLSGAAQNFTYQIPMSLQSDQTRLRLIVRDAAGNSAQAITANNFSIMLGADTIPPTVTISQPSQSQSIVAGQPIQVKWQSTDNRAVVSQALLLSLDGGKTFSQISSFGATDNSFVLSNLDKLNFTTPQAIVKITAIDSTGNKGEANSTFTIAPAVTNVVYQPQNKLLSITGIGFMSNVNNTVRLFVNGKEVSLTPKSVSNSTFTIKGNKKKLTLTKGANTAQLVVDGVMSNSFGFTF